MFHQQTGIFFYFLFCCCYLRAVQGSIRYYNEKTSTVNPVFIAFLYICKVDRILKRSNVPSTLRRKNLKTQLYFYS